MFSVSLTARRAVLGTRFVSSNQFGGLWLKQKSSKVEEEAAVVQ